jgi:hypothetical protein
MESTPNNTAAKVDETDEPGSPTDKDDEKLSDNKSKNVFIEFYFSFVLKYYHTEIYPTFLRAS